MTEAASRYRLAAYRTDSKPLSGVTATKIMSFTSLPEGWHYRDGGPIQPTVVRRALRVCGDMIISRFSKTDAFPRIAGDVRVTAYADPHYLQVDVHTNGLYSIVYELGDEEKFHLDEVDYKFVFNAIRKFAGTIWSSSDSSIQGITTLTETGSRVGHLTNRQMAEPPSLTRFAPGILTPA